MTWLWTILGILISLVIGVDAIKNTQSYRNIGLRLGDGCRSLWFWPMNIRAAYLHTPRHSARSPLPEFMRSWHLS